MISILSLGAGVQSTALALMATRGVIALPDCAIFADTGEEPRATGHDNGPFSVADPRPITPGGIAEQADLPAAAQKLVAVIRALDGTWHRPFTTLELAALQGLVEPDDYLVLEGTSDSAWRERIGNAVPKHTATAIGGVMGRALLLAMTGQTFVLSAEPIWVHPIIVALTVDVPRVRP